MSKQHVLSLILIFTAFFSSVAQCAMCKATLENQEEGSAVGSTLNDGILFLMAMPYILLATIGGVFYYRYKKMRKA